jgi:hypothetical protein
MARLLILMSLLVLGCSPEVTYRTADSTTAAHLAQSLEIPQCDPQLLTEKRQILSTASGLVSEILAEFNSRTEGEQHAVFVSQLTGHLQMTRKDCVAFFEKWGDRPCQTIDDAGEVQVVDLTDLKTSCTNLGGLDSL